MAGSGKLDLSYCTLREYGEGWQVCRKSAPCAVEGYGYSARLFTAQAEALFRFNKAGPRGGLELTKEGRPEVRVASGSILYVA
jgi:hypothetical protein